MRITTLIVMAIFPAVFLSSCSKTPGDGSNLERNKEIVRQAEQAINQSEFDLLNQFYADDFKRYSQATPGFEEADREDFINMMRGFFEAFPDAQQTSTLLVAEGDYVAFWGAFEGTQQGPMPPFPATGIFMSSDYAGIHRIEDGRIVETWVTWDNMSMLSQLGLLPEPGSTSQ